MSKKNFILTALVINLTICLTLCIVLFTDKNTTKGNNDKTVLENMSSNQTSDNENEFSDDITIHNTTTSDKNTDSGETTSKIVESQVSSETLPSTYNNNTTPMTTIPEETTVPQETAIVINGTTALIKSSCNIRSSADVGGNVIGTANAGNSYTIDKAKCSSDWIAIYINAGTVGYISSSFCTIQ